MQNLTKRICAVFLALCMTLALAPVVPVEAREVRNVNIHLVDGENATIARQPGGREAMPREGQRLSEGNVLQTGWDTQIYLRVDQTSMVKMDESSRLQVAAARSLLTLSIQSGSALVDVETQPADYTLETRIGSTVMTVRGTLYIMGRRHTEV